MSKTMKYHPDKGWIDIEEWMKEKLIDDIVDRIMSDLDFEVEVDLKTGKGKITAKRKMARKA